MIPLCVRVCVYAHEIFILVLFYPIITIYQQKYVFFSFGALLYERYEQK